MCSNASGCFSIYSCILFYAMSTILATCSKQIKSISRELNLCASVVLNIP